MRTRIGGRFVGPEDPLFVIAELGLNHRGSLDRALALVDAACRAGASAVKLQTLNADRLVTPGAPAPSHVRAPSMHDFFERFELDATDHRAIARRARERGLVFLSTPFDESAIGMLESVGCDAYKIASGDLTHDRLITRAARTGKPLILSTGMSDMDEIREAVGWAQNAGAVDIVLMHCVSAYPVPSGSENLRAIAEMARVFGLPVGLSDHGTDPLSASLAVALGASVYEKHLMLQQDGEDVDENVSVTPGELAAIVRVAERARRALGSGEKTCLPAETENLKASRRGLYAARSMKAGEIVTPDVIAALRPASEFEPSRWRDLVGERLRRDVAVGSAFQKADFEQTASVRSFRDVA